MMSHFRECRLSLTSSASSVLLTLAVREIAHRYRAAVTDTVTDYWGNKRRVLAAVEGLYGVELTPEGVVVVGDEYNKPVKLEAFRRELERTYAALALNQALTAMGYRVQSQRTETGAIYLYGVKAR